MHFSCMPREPPSFNASNIHEFYSTLLHESRALSSSASSSMRLTKQSTTTEVTRSKSANTCLPTI